MVDRLEVTDRSFVFHNGARLGIGRRPNGVFLQLSYGREELAIELPVSVVDELARWLTISDTQHLSILILAECRQRYGDWNGRRIAAVILTRYAKLGDSEVAGAVGVCRQTVAAARKKVTLPVDAGELVELARGGKVKKKIGRPKKKKGLAANLRE